MELQTRLTTIEDYPELVAWWKYHKWKEPPSIDLLDNLRFGVMVSVDGVNICAGFIYFTNAKAFGLMEYIVSSYIVRDKAIRKRAIRHLIATLLKVAESKEVKVVLSFLKSEHLINHYKFCKFEEGGKSYTSMIKAL